MVVAPFLEIQRKMLPRHLRLKGTLFCSFPYGLLISHPAFTVFLSWFPVLSSFASEMSRIPHFPLVPLKCHSVSVCHQCLLGLNNLHSPHTTPTPAPLAPQWQTLHTETRVDFSKVMIQS